MSFALVFDALRRATQMMKMLIRAGAKVDVRDCEGYAPVHYAADMGHLPVLRELMRAGSSHAWRQNGFQTPLALACFKGHFACVKYLLDDCKADPRAGGNVRSTPLAIAAHRGHLETVKMLLRFGVRQLGPYSYNDALCRVAMNGDVRMMRELLNVEGGVHSKGVKTSDDRTLLHYSAGHCHPLVTSMLLKAGADETVKEATGKTPSDVVDTLTHEHVRNGLEQRRVRRMLTQAPAYRALSWSWPNASVALAPSPTPTPGKGKKAADSAAGKAGAGSAKGATEPGEMTAEELDRAFDVAMPIATASARTELVGLKVYRRPATSSSGSAADGHSAVVASMIRYAIGARYLSSKPADALVLSAIMRIR